MNIEVSLIMEIQSYAPYEEQIFNLARKAYQIRLVRGYAHELNNLLTGILGYSQLLITVETSEDMEKEQLKDIESSAQRSRITIRQMSRLWRSYESLPLLLDIKNTVSTIISSIKYHSERKGIQITQEYLGNDLSTTVIEEDFEDAFYSLFTALISEGPEQSQLQIIVERIENTINITLESSEYSRITDILISVWSGVLTLQDLLQKNIHFWVFLRLLHAMNGDIQRHNDLRSAVVISIPAV
ncbi:MAG: histidine kinase dimerization/phospho-acceptor domain-containing protein [Candidatus Xenobiia bacterium LiM19]